MAKAIININIEDSNQTAAHDSLITWLANHEYVQKKVGFSQETVQTESAAGAIALITLVLENTLEVFKLTSVFTEWCARPGSKAAPIVVKANGMRSVLSVEDMKKQEVVHRALSGVPDPRKSRCVLVGVSRYTRLERLGTVEDNLRDLQEAITAPASCGIPPGRVRAISDPTSEDLILDVINEAAEEETDTLLFYYAGHGILDDTRGLLLTLPDADREGRHGVIAWSDLAQIINHAPSQRRVVVLDCCYGGRALPNKETSSELRDAAEKKAPDTYILAAAHNNEEAWSPKGERYTAFTGELLEVLRHGIKSGSETQEFLDLNAITHAIRESLGSKMRPQPERHSPNGIGELPYLRNPAWKNRKTWSLIPAPGDHNGRIPLPKPPRLRLLAYAVVIAVVAVLAVTQIPRLFHQGHNKRVGGVSLTAYCHSQNLTISGSYCLRTANLKAACNWQYHAHDLNYRFTSRDPNSAICYNSSVTHNAGITDMLHYCQDSTGSSGVIATAENPAYKGTWVCEEKIDMNVVCIAKYNEPDLQARQDSNGYWWCYA